MFLSHRNQSIVIRNSLRKQNISIFNEVYCFLNQNHACNTRGSTNQMLVVPQVQTTQCVEHSRREKCPNTEFFWSVFSCIRTEYRDLLCRSSYSIRIQESTDQKRLHKSRSMSALNLYQRYLKIELITCNFSKFKKLIFQYHLNQY